MIIIICLVKKTFRHKRTPKWLLISSKEKFHCYFINCVSLGNWLEENEKNRCFVQSNIEPKAEENSSLHFGNNFYDNSDNFFFDCVSDKIDGKQQINPICNDE